MEIIVNFDTPTRKLRATVVGPIKGVLILDEVQRAAFRKANGRSGDALTAIGKTIPPQVRLTTQDGAPAGLDGEEGPPVCYWVEETLVCW